VTGLIDLLDFLTGMTENGLPHMLSNLPFRRQSNKLITQLTQAQAWKDTSSHRKGGCRVGSGLWQINIVSGSSMWIATQGVRFADSMQNDVDYTAAGGCHDVFKKATNNGVEADVCFSVSKRRVSATRIR
jgi:hypothetical protein